MGRDRRPERPPDRPPVPGASSSRSSGALDVAARALVGVGHAFGVATRPVRRMWRSDDPLDAYTLVHMASVAGDAMVAIALADSVFFSIPVGQAKVKVALYLGLTMAPLAFAAPLMVPLLDRGGFRRAISFGAGAGRAVVALYAAPRFDTILLFPLAFVLLVLSRVHAITKNGLTTAYAPHGEALVQVNARMNRLAVVSGAVAAAPGVVALKLGGAPAVLVLAALCYAGTSLLIIRLPRLRTTAGGDEVEPVGRRGNIPALAAPAAATAGLRGANGFLTLLVAFALRASSPAARHGAPKWWFAVVLAGGLAGAFLGDVVAPRLSRRDQAAVLASLFVAGVAALLAFAEFGLVLLAVFGLLAGVSTEIGRLAFQSLMQRSAPGSAQGRVFVRYEVLFQLAWVAGAFLPALLSIKFRTGMLLLAGFYLALGAAYAMWPRLARRREQASEPAPG
ncbi:MAG: hypothetical protein ACJ77A_03380 [Actinomycetota bacterium]